MLRLLNKGPCDARQHYRAVVDSAYPPQYSSEHQRRGKVAETSLHVWRTFRVESRIFPDTLLYFQHRLSAAGLASYWGNEVFPATARLIAVADLCLGIMEPGCP